MTSSSCLSDINIARAAVAKPVAEIAEKINIPPSALINYGNDKAKVSLNYIDSLKDRPDGKLILVTAITPDPRRRGQDHDHCRPW